MAPIRPDRLWFFTGAGFTKADENIANVPNPLVLPDGTNYNTTNDQIVANVFLRLTSQVTPRNKFAAAAQKTPKRKGESFGAGVDPYYGGQQWDFKHLNYSWGTLKWTSAATSRLLFEAGYAYNTIYYRVDMHPWAEQPKYLPDGRVNPAWIANAPSTDTALNKNPRCLLPDGCTTWGSYGQQMGEYARANVYASSVTYVTVASGGYYLDEMYPPEISKWSEDQIAQEIIKDATMNPLGALGEIGTSAEITPNEHKVLRAVGKAHLATNLPIFTHTDNGKCAEQQLDIFESVGVKAQHVVIGHISSMADTDVEMQKRLCKRGAFIGFDRQGAGNDDRNVPMVLKILEAGYADNLVFSADYGNAARNANTWTQNGGTGLSRTVTVWVPKLRAAGVKEETLHGILVNNSRRFLAFVPKKPRKA